MECYGDLECSVVIETMDKYGQISKRRNMNNAFLKLGRDEFNDVKLKINGESFALRDFKVLHKFVKDGKASLIFSKIFTNILFSNAPPDKLSAFLKIMRIKTSIQKHLATDRMKLYSTTAKTFEDISPLTVNDVNKFKGNVCLKSPQQSVPLKRKSSDITPIRVSSQGIACVNGRPRKRLNSAPLTLVKLGEKNLKPSKNTTETKDTKLGLASANKMVNLTGKLTNEQTRILGAVKQGFNIFFTGSAGTGKSYLLRKIIGALPPDTTVASASTGVAACQIGGITLHAFAGIGSGEGSFEHCLQLASRMSVSRNWKRCQTLIIDEISMVNSTFFEKLEKIARTIRKDDRPFGGIQLVLCGDFLQLPPVVKKDQEKSFCFQSKCWSSCIQLNFELTEIKRQSDQEFINILQHIRVGKCPDHIYEKLVQTQHNEIEKFGIQPTRLCTHKDSVEEINDLKMKGLKTVAKTFMSIDSDMEYTEQMDKSLQVFHKLQLKVEAQVMLTKNLDVGRGLVNGARGVVTKFATDKDEFGISIQSNITDFLLNFVSRGLPYVRFSQGLLLMIKREKFLFKTPGGVVTRAQLPLKLAWAISIHKSQGLTLDCCEVSLSRVFEHGQAYVALSRSKCLQGLRVLDMDRSHVKAHSDVLRFYIRLRREMRIASIEEKENKEC